MYKIRNSSNLSGTIQVSGSKNAALPIFCANLLTDNKVQLNNMPKINDINVLQEVAKQAESNKNYYDLTTNKAQKIRASILLIPIGLLKYGEVKFLFSGGCNIGKRPLDSFDNTLKQAGIDITQDNTKIYKKANKPNKNIILPEFSVSTSEAVITYLSFLEDVDYEITVHQIAIEPHVINLIEFLNNIGANIQLHHNHSVTIKPSKIEVKNQNFDIIGDYIEAGTFFGIAATTKNSDITIKGFNVDELASLYNIAQKIGINFHIIDKQTIQVDSKNLENYKPIKLETRISPGFPTDLQSIFGVLLTQINGVSRIFETLFEGRFGYLAELENLGANLEIVNPHQTLIIGSTPLKGDYVSTTDLRGGGAMILAGIIAEGETYITNENIILRGYENIEEKLRYIGVDIKKI